MYSEGFVSRAELGRAAKIFMALLAASAISSTPAATLTVAWDASISANVVGYKVYYGPASRNYTNSVSTSATSLSISNLIDGQMYYFAATAYDTFGVESDYSSETNYVPTSGRPTNTAPVISIVADQNVAPGAVLGPIAFFVTDAETPATQLTVTA